MIKLRYLPDANVRIARAFEVHVYHLASEWFGINMSGVTAVLEKLTQHPDYQFHPLAQDWRTLTTPFFRRLQGHKQVMGSYLLGQAILEDLALVTLIRHFCISQENTVSMFTS